MQVLRPLKIGDVINAGGLTGTVKELGLFDTTIVTPDNIATIIGNNKIFSDNIANYSVTPYRRVDLTAKIANGVDAVDAINRLKEAVQKIPNVLSNPVPVVGVLQFTPEGLCCLWGPSTQPANYWRVYGDTNHAIRDAQYPTLETPISHRTT